MTWLDAGDVNFVPLEAGDGEDLTPPETWMEASGLLNVTD